MATDNLQAGSTPANDLPHELGRQPHESSQQHADRLLEAYRSGVDVGRIASDPFINREALDQLELGNCNISYINALTHAVMDAVEKVHGLVRTDGVHRNDTIARWTEQAINLLSLQMEQNKSAEENVYAGIMGWPRTAGHRL